MSVSADCLKLTRLFFTPAERSDAELILQLEHAATIVDSAIIQTLQSHQRNALLCLVSDLQAGYISIPIPFEETLLARAVNRQMLQVAAAEFHAFCYLHGKASVRAWEKRRAEQYLFTRGQLVF